MAEYEEIVNMLLYVILVIGLKTQFGRISIGQSLLEEVFDAGLTLLR